MQVFDRVFILKYDHVRDKRFRLEKLTGNISTTNNVILTEWTGDKSSPLKDIQHVIEIPPAPSV